jgi:hypothetical protein
MEAKEEWERRPEVLGELAGWGVGTTAPSESMKRPQDRRAPSEKEKAPSFHHEREAFLWEIGSVQTSEAELDHPMASEEKCWQEVGWEPLPVEVVQEVPEEAWRRLQQHRCDAGEPVVGAAMSNRTDHFRRRERRRWSPQTICTTREN